MSLQNKTDDFLVWQFDFALTTFFEIETHLIQPLLPPQLHPIEAVAGVSLINLTAFNFPAGALGSLPEFQELIFSAIVTPDLSRGVPKFAMYVLSIGSSCQEHLDHSFDYYKLPVYERLLHGIIRKDKLAVEYGDSLGKILTMHNCANQVIYKKDEKRYFQAFTSKNNQIYIADVYIQASLYEHQEIGNVGMLYNHPFFKNLGFDEADPVSYLQMIGEPGAIGQQLYYRPEIF